MKRLNLNESDKNFKEIEERLQDYQDRMRAVGMYLQTIRVMSSFKYLNNPERFFVDKKDYDRILNVLQMDDYPEGF